ncbi:MAG TPA: hypothetical protein VFK86_12510 [Bauldia sp.]|nr:hypothetical protein [Bauldia sp.]
MSLAGLALAVAVSVGAANAALACQGSQVLYEDGFATLEPTWGGADDAFFVEDERLIIMPGYDEYYSALNTMGTYEDIDLCVDLEPIKADPEGNSFAGVIFWAIDYDNYYYVVVTAEQSIGVFRRQRGRVLPQLRWATFDALKRGNGVVNQIRIVTLGNTATIYVNGQQYGTIKGQPPSDGQQIGVRATSPRNERAVWAFDNVKITAPEIPQTQ